MFITAVHYCLSLAFLIARTNIGGVVSGVCGTIIQLVYCIRHRVNIEPYSHVFANIVLHMYFILLHVLKMQKT